VKTSHPGEGLNHIQAKALLLRWLASAYPHVDARDEVRAEDRVADLLVSNPATGNRMAIEIQYSPLQNWHARSASYANMGVVDQWIFGSQGRQAKRRKDDTLRLTPPQRALVRETKPLLWINPVTEEVATGFVWRDGKPRIPTASDDWVDLRVEPLTNCRLTLVGIRTNTTLELGMAEEVKPRSTRHPEARLVEEPVYEAEFLISVLDRMGPSHPTGLGALRRLREQGVPGY